MEQLFVYGSLQPGGSNADQLADLEGEWRRGWVRGRLREAGWGAVLGYPALTLDPEGERVHGRVLASSGLASRWSDLDAFEGAEYERVTAEVTLDDGSRLRAWVYVLRRPTARRG